MADIKIVVTDGHELVREGLCSLLEKEKDIEVVAEAENSADTVRYCNGHRPDVVLIDPDSSDCSTLVYQSIREASPNSSILVMSSSDDPRLTRETFKCGVEGYVLKARSSEELKKALRQVYDGDPYVDPKVAAALVHFDDENNGLTDREREILGLIAFGFTNSEVAQKMFLSVRTVESHRAHICQKLDAHNRHDLVMAAIELGLMDLTGSTPNELGATG